MQTMMKKPLMTLVAGAVLLAGTALRAADTPEFDYTGIVDGVNTESSLLVVDDQAIRFGPGLVVHKADGTSSVGPASLALGTAVGFVQQSRNDQPYISEIWVLNRLPPQAIDDEGDD